MFSLFFLPACRLSNVWLSKLGSLSGFPSYMVLKRVELFRVPTWDYDLNSYPNDSCLRVPCVLPARLACENCAGASALASSSDRRLWR